MKRFGLNYFLVAALALFLAASIYLTQTIRTYLVTHIFIQSVRVSSWRSRLSRAILIASVFCTLSIVCISGGKKERVSGTLYTHVNL